MDFRINKGNAAQSFMFKNRVCRPMGKSTESTLFLLLLAIMQPILFFLSIEVFGLNGTAFITAILILILIMLIIWMWVSGKNPFASYTDGWDTHAFRDGNRTVHSVSS